MDLKFGKSFSKTLRSSEAQCHNHSITQFSLQTIKHSEPVGGDYTSHYIQKGHSSEQALPGLTSEAADP